MPSARNPRQYYNKALDDFRRAAQKFRLAQHAYRAREIGDKEFLAARAEYDIADKASDIAEANLKAAYSQAAERGFTKDPVLEEISAKAQSRWAKTEAENRTAQKRGASKRSKSKRKTRKRAIVTRRRRLLGRLRKTRKRFNRRRRDPIHRAPSGAITRRPQDIERAASAASNRRFHVVAISEHGKKAGQKVYMTATPVTHREGTVILSKMTPYSWLRYQLEPVN